jgi:type II secretory pathway component PulF
VPIYRYKIRDKYGRPSTGTIEGESKETIASHFKKMGYSPVSIEEQGPGLKRFNPLERFFQNVSSEELVVFTRQLMTLQRAGVPILVSLGSVKEQANNRYFKKAIEDITHEIETGKSLSDSISKFHSIFSEIYVNMIRSGEAAGILDNVLDRLANLLEHEQDIRMKIKQATRYPLLVIISICLAFPITVLFIMPKFTALFSSLGAQLPLATRLLLNFNYLLVHFWHLVIIALVILVASVRYFINTKTGRSIWDGIKLKVPVFGPLFLKIAMSRFSRMTAVLSASGIPIINTLAIVKGAVGNRIIANSIENIIHAIEEGKGLTEPMKASGLFPSIVIQMVGIGEETGKIDELLLRVSEYYDAQVDYTVKNLSVLIEPVLIFIMGILVLILAMAIFMPLWSMISIFRH